MPKKQKSGLYRSKVTIGADSSGKPVYKLNLVFLCLIVINVPEFRESNHSAPRYVCGNKLHKSCTKGAA